ncbi:MAG: hypothetical protein WBA74_02690 [Cyclobacteriaceae bacterium]
MNLVSKIFTVVFIASSLVLAWFLYDSIKSSIDEEERLQFLEQKIVDRLVMIRDAQDAYKAVKGQYTSDWDKLINFIDTGRFYIIDRRETIITLDYGADSIYVELDTVGTKSVMDSVFSKKNYPDFSLRSLPYVPVNEPEWKDVKFKMWADKIDKSGVMVDVVEVWNPKPVDPRRKEDEDRNTRRPLRFGSRTSVSTAGNWE